VCGIAVRPATRLKNFVANDLLAIAYGAQCHAGGLRERVGLNVVVKRGTFNHSLLEVAGWIPLMPAW
jgi:hypothetical protein